ncbi:MAG: hypothetical protein ACREEZ_12150 [Stellaceae bacterium]
MGIGAAHVALLSAKEPMLWQAERDRAAADGLLFMAHPLHCAVGAEPPQGRAG